MIRCIDWRTYPVGYDLCKPIPGPAVDVRHERRANVGRGQTLSDLAAQLAQGLRKSPRHAANGIWERSRSPDAAIAEWTQVDASLPTLCLLGAYSTACRPLPDCILKP